MHRLAALSLAVVMVGGPAAGQPLPLDRVIEEDVSIRLPLPDCAVGGIAGRIARIIQEPAGIEYWPGSCRVEPRRPGDVPESVRFTGMAAREALDRLVELDPRYRWSESNGVIVVRPLVAWTDPTHFLHRTGPSFRVSDQHMGGALEAIMTALGPFPRAPSLELRTFTTPQGNHRFSVDLGATSIIEALDAVVRAHGALLWTVTYCLPQARHENATVSFLAYDGSGIGSHGAVLTDAVGKSYSPCYPATRR